MYTVEVGYARAEITPQESVPLAGYGNTSGRMSNNILDPLFATCIAFVNEAGEKALIFTVDLIDAGKTVTTRIRPAISEATGILVEYIHVSGTHSHAAPDTRNDTVESIHRYWDYQQEQMVKAAVEALADVKPARLYLTRAVTKNLNFVRHYIMEDGTIAGPNFGNLKQKAVGHVRQPDPEMLLAKITRKGGKDVLLCNFGVHQTHTGGQKRLNVSADIAGAMRARMEEEADCLFAYFTGACGNVIPGTRIEQERVVPDLDHIAHGRALAQYAIDAADTYTEASFGAIRTLERTVECEINHTTDHLAEKAAEVYDYFFKVNDAALANEYAIQRGFLRVYHAGAIMRRKKLPASDEIPLNVLCVGDLAFVVAPYEMFCESGMEIKENSPFGMTFVLTLGNRASMGYMPTRPCFEYNSYEAYNGKYMPGIGEKLSGDFVDLIQDLYKSIK